MLINDNKKFVPIAIVGVGAIFPGSTDAQGFWRDIVNGNDLIKDVPPGHWLIDDYYDANPAAVDKTYCKRGAFITDIAFDPIEYGIPPTNVPAIDTSQLLALVVAKQVLNDATEAKFHNMDLSRVSVILGTSALEALQYVAARMQRPVWSNALREAGIAESQIQSICDQIAGAYAPWQENTFPGLLGNVVAGRVANRFNLGGTNCVTDAACASSLAAMSMAVNELQQGTSDMAITGGVDTLNDIIMFMCFSKTHALSLSGDCRPFSDKADGTILGEGLGMFALKRLTDAERDANTIYAVIRGIGTASDGRSKSIYAPLAKGQRNAILRAYDLAEYSCTTVEMIEAHGTGTKAGDAAEFEGLRTAFTAQDNTAQQYCALGSIKSQIGHTKSAAGAAGLFKAVMALHHKVLPPTIKIDKPNPELNFNQSPFYLNTELRPWIHNKSYPRRAGVSSFGFGGSNFHIALEEYVGAGNKPKRLRAVPTELIIFAAENPSALIAEVKALLKDLTQQPNEFFAYLARNNQENYVPEKLARLAITASDLADLHSKLNQALISIAAAPDKQFSTPQGIHYGYALNPGRVAFLFPGQGSQYVGMGKDLALHFSTALSAWDQVASEIADCVFPRPALQDAARQELEQALMQTDRAQPALAIASLIQLQLLQALKIYPDCTAGHSFGELVALHAAGAMDANVLLTAAQKRGQLMHAAAKNNAGAMLSVIHPVANTLAILQEKKLAATPANFNSPMQLALSGSIPAIQAAEQCFLALGIKCQRLKVAAAFHSASIATEQKTFATFLNTLTWSPPKIPVYANTTAMPYPNASNAIPEYLAEQLVKPVKFQEQIENLYKIGVRTFIEVGPQAVLTSLVEQCLDKRVFQAVALDRRGKHGVTSLWDGLGKLFVAGFNPNFSAVWQDYAVGDMPQKIVHKSHVLKINGTNYAKPYPPVNGVKKSVPISVSTNLKEIPMSQANNPQLIQMYQELQRQLVDAHNTYQRTMADSHVAFLNSISQLATQTLGNGVAVAMSQQLQTAMVAPVAVPQHQQPMQMAAPTMSAPIVIAKPVMPPPVAMVAAQQPAPVIPSVAVAPAPAPAPAPAQVSPPVAAAKPNQPQAHNLKDLVLEIVVEKTGYPADMLNMDMAIEADLGIDSIKRVEILSILAERAPHLPAVNPNELAEMQTLGDIVAYMERGNSG